jgi:hypothetical protein
MVDPEEYLLSGEWMSEHALVCAGAPRWHKRAQWAEGAVGVFRCDRCGYETELLLLRDDVDGPIDPEGGDLS